MKWIYKFIFLFFSLVIFGQNEDPNYVVNFITVKEGLSHNYTTSIVSDQLYMKWIGTENGITKYNGYDFNYIKPSEAYKGLTNENIEVLFTDANDNLWIGTKSGGLSFFDIKKNTIQNFNSIIETKRDEDLRITAIAQDNEGLIWVGTWNKGVFVIDPIKAKLYRHFNYRTPVYSIKKDFEGKMWFTNGKILMMYSPETKKVKRKNFEYIISDILPDEKRNKTWISTTSTNNYLYSYQTESDKLDSLPTNVHSNFSKKLMLDHQNRIWIGTWGNGVHRSNKDLTSFKKLDVIRDSPGKIEGNYSTILSLHEDQNNIVWLSTVSGGIIKLQEENGFQNLAQNLSETNLKEKLNCYSVFKNNDFVFVGTLFAGVYFGKDFHQLSKLEAIEDIKINTFYEFDEKLFIGTAEGFHIFDLTTEELIFENNQIKKVTAFLVQEDNLYIGTQQNGIALVELKDLNNIEKYSIYNEKNNESSGLKSNRVTSIKSDQNQNIWVSTYKGLHLFNQQENLFVHHSKIIDQEVSINIINSLETVGSLLWLSTPNGLMKLNYKNNLLQFQEVIDKRSGLNSDFICASTLDNNLNLWISTHTEIVKYNKADETLTSYGETNGVKTSLFNNNSAFNYNNQSIIFGGIDNITYFNPKDIRDYNTTPKVVFTGLRVKNEEISYNKEQKNLTESLNYAQEINLDYKDDFFSIRFVANDFLGKLNIKYRYTLDGYQDQWVDLNGINEVNFASLQPGEYTLKVQASRDNQNWSEPSEIKISLAGSPWKSNLAYFIYFSILASIFGYFWWLNNYRLRLKNKLELAKLDEQKKIELTEAKLNFFTNISHEFRTPLTLIISPIKDLLENQNLSAEVNKKLSYIDKNTTRLLNLINQLLDFRKADYGLLKLKASYGNFVRFSNEVYLYFKEAAREKKIKYTFIYSQDEIRFPFDRNKLEIVLCNLLSNAIKYTQEKGEINLDLNVKENYCIIKISDSGIGIKARDVQKIFDRFFQIESANSAKMVGSGIGLSFSKKIIEIHHGEIYVKSKPNKGTTFIIKLPMNPETYGNQVDESFLTTDNIKAYNIEKNTKPVKSLEIKNTEKQQIMVVDDNSEILDYLRSVLEKEYDIIIAKDGEEGVEKALEEVPDLIISDVMMPKKDGIALCKELKTNINTSHIPIILLTARTSTVYEIGGLKNGADDYVTKPFNANVIKARISSLLENRDKLRSHFQNKIRFEPASDEVEKDSDPENSFIHKAMLLVEENLENEDFGIDTMVQELHMSRSSLFRKIKSLTGFSLSAFIRSVRLKKAAYLILTEEDITLKEVAFQVGFNTYKYFKNSFQKQFNCLPSEYKEKNINKLS